MQPPDAALAKFAGIRDFPPFGAAAIGAALAALLTIPFATGARAHGPSPAAIIAAPFRLRGEPLTEAVRWLGHGNPTGSRGPWCADFVSFVLRRVGRRPLSSRLAASALAYGPRLAAPRPGALVVMSTSAGWAAHVGFVEGVARDGAIRIVSGNWRDRVSLATVPREHVVAIIALD